MTRLINFMLYQLGWFACVLGLAWDQQWLGVSLAVLLVGIHFWLAKDRSIQIKLTLIAAVFGLALDSAQMWAGVFQFPHGTIIAGLPPPAMPILWLQFATTFRYSLRWLNQRFALAAAFGLVGAPVAFFAGEAFGAIEILSPRLMNFAILGFLWALSVPLLVFICQRLAAHDAVPPNYVWPALADVNRDSNQVVDGR